MPTSLTSAGLLFPDNTTQTSGLPSGIITMWSGSLGSIPSGWKLCDGTNGTPNLSSRFIIGAGNTYSIGCTGGCADYVIPNHTHSGSTTSSNGTHNHSITGSSHTHSLNTAPGYFVVTSCSGGHQHQLYANNYPISYPPHFLGFLRCTLPSPFGPEYCNYVIATGHWGNTDYGGGHVHCHCFVTNTFGQHSHTTITTSSEGLHCHAVGGSVPASCYGYSAPGGAHRHSIGTCSAPYCQYDPGQPGLCTAVMLPTITTPGAVTGPGSLVYTGATFDFPPSGFNAAHWHEGNACIAGVHTHVANISNVGGHCHSSYIDICFVPNTCLHNHLTPSSNTCSYINSAGYHCHWNNLATSSSATLTSNGNHTHAITIQQAGTGSSSNMNLPPFYVLAYIMKA